LPTWPGPAGPWMASSLRFSQLSQTRHPGLVRYVLTTKICLNRSLISRRNATDAAGKDSQGGICDRALPEDRYAPSEGLKRLPVPQVTLSVALDLSRPELRPSRSMRRGTIWRPRAVPSPRARRYSHCLGYRRRGQDQVFPGHRRVGTRTRRDCRVPARRPCRPAPDRAPRC
jgi:hypothetical protein